MLNSMNYLDFSKEALLIESFMIGHYSKGGFSYDVLKDLPFNEYEILVKEAIRVSKLNDKKEESAEDE